MADKNFVENNNCGNLASAKLQYMFNKIGTTVPNSPIQDKAAVSVNSGFIERSLATPQAAAPLLKQPYKENESFYHKTAKLLLTRWLKEQEDSNESCYLSPFAWRKNYGIYPELKFYNQSNPYYFEQGRNRGRILFVPDITIFHKGQATILIEIIHKNPPSIEKLFTINKFFYGYPFELYSVQMDDILKLTQKPNYIIAKQII